MTKDQFNKEVCNIMGKCYALLNAKAAEYATDEDRLSAFKEAALLSKNTAETIAVNYMLKHIMSINDMSKRPWKYSPEMWDEKLGDAINYLLIIKALIAERNIAKKHMNSMYGISATKPKNFVYIDTDSIKIGKVMKRRFENED